MAWIWLVVGFLGFMIAISAVNAMDRHAESRWGYRPFAVPNLAFMLIPHGIAIAAITGLIGRTDSEARLPAPILWLGVVLGLAAVAAMLWIIRRRANTPVAVVATLVMIAAASVLIPSMLFRALADAQPGD